MINGTAIRAARERAGWDQAHLARMVGVSERTVGNWERGTSTPRNREGALRRVLADHLDDGGTAATLTTASDAELLAEIARRFARADREQVMGNGQHPAPIDAAEATAEEVTAEELERATDQQQPPGAPGRGRRR